VDPRVARAAHAVLFPFGPLVFLGVFLPLLLFGHLAEEVWDGGGFGWDQSLLLFFHDNASPALDDVMLVFTRLGGWIAVPIVTVGTAVFLLLRGRRGDAIFLGLSVGGAMLINVILKHVFGRARPALWESIAPESSFSFPSGHAMASMSLAAALVVILWPSRWRWLALAIGAVYVAGVGVSRVYLGVHYPSDIVAGWCGALAWVLGLHVVRRARSEHIRA
jgi:undecaprenyl-diphosphatase